MVPEKVKPPLSGWGKLWYASHVFFLLLISPAKEGKESSEFPYPCGSKKQILKMTRGKPHCYICGLRIFVRDHWQLPEAFSIDHVVPRSKGGTNTRLNLRPAHRLCNIVKEHPTMTPKTARKIKAMQERIAKRLSQELDKATQDVV